MEQFREFKDLDEEGRKEAFEKFVRRQKVCHQGGRGTCGV